MSDEAKETREWLTISEVCERLSVSRRTVYNWINTGRLAYLVTPSGTRRIHESSLLREPKLLP